MLTDVKAQKVGEEQFSRDDWDLVSLTVSKDTDRHGLQRESRRERKIVEV